MLLFGVSFNLYYLILLKKWKRVGQSNELWTYLGIFLAASIVITLNIYPMYENLSDAFRLSAFQVSSIITTTGFATADFNLWPQLSKAVLLLLMFVGGCMGSTAGGIKVSRVVVLFQSAKNEIHRNFSPRTVNPVKLNGRCIDAREEKAALSYLALYFAVFIIVFVLISFEPFGFETNFSAAASCVNNIAPASTWSVLHQALRCIPHFQSLYFPLPCSWADLRFILLFLFSSCAHGPNDRGVYMENLVLIFGLLFMFLLGAIIIKVFEPRDEKKDSKKNIKKKNGKAK